MKNDKAKEKEIEIDYKPKYTISEVAKEIRENFKETNGRLLTGKEAIEYTKEIRKSFKKQKES